MKTLDLKKTLKHLYLPSAKEPVLVEVPEMQFVMVTGRIQPGETPGTSPAFQQAMEAMYGMSYTLKFASKLRKEDPIDYPVMALEALWWVEDGQFDITPTGQLALAGDDHAARSHHTRDVRRCIGAAAQEEGQSRVGSAAFRAFP